MNEIKIPEGHKATILGGVIRIEPIEQKQEFNDGDILCLKHRPKCVFVFKSGKYSTTHYVGVRSIGTLSISTGDSIKSMSANEPVSLATESQKQLLFDTLAKEGKYWDAEALEVKDFIKVPENIGIYRYKDDSVNLGNDRLYIGFNKNSQLLGCTVTKYGAFFSVDINSDAFDRVQCYLKPCKREDLKSGDTAFISRANNLCRHDMYYKKIDESEYGFVRVFDDGVRQVDIKSDYNTRFYKLIPINDNH